MATIKIKTIRGKILQAWDKTKNKFLWQAFKPDNFAYKEIDTIKAIKVCPEVGYMLRLFCPRCCSKEIYAHISEPLKLLDAYYKDNKLVLITESGEADSDTTKFMCGKCGEYITKHSIECFVNKKLPHEQVSEIKYMIKQRLIKAFYETGKPFYYMNTMPNIIFVAAVVSKDNYLFKEFNSKLIVSKNAILQPHSEDDSYKVIAADLKAFGIDLWSHVAYDFADCDFAFNFDRDEIQAEILKLRYKEQKAEAEKIAAETSQEEIRRLRDFIKSSIPGLIDEYWYEGNFDDFVEPMEDNDYITVDAKLVFGEKIFHIKETDIYFDSDGYRKDFELKFEECLRYDISANWRTYSTIVDKTPPFLTFNFTVNELLEYP